MSKVSKPGKAGLWFWGETAKGRIIFRLDKVVAIESNDVDPIGWVRLGGAEYGLVSESFAQFKAAWAGYIADAR